MGPDLIGDDARVVSVVGVFQRDDQRCLMVVVMEIWSELGATGRYNGSVVRGMR